MARIRNILYRDLLPTSPQLPPASFPTPSNTGPTLYSLYYFVLVRHQGSFPFCHYPRFLPSSFFIPSPLGAVRSPPDASSRKAPRYLGLLYSFSKPLCSHASTRIKLPSNLRRVMHRIHSTPLYRLWKLLLNPDNQCVHMLQEIPLVQGKDLLPAPLYPYPYLQH